MEKIQILGVPIDKVDMKEAVKRATDAIEDNRKFFIVTPNSEIVVEANKNEELLSIIKKADLVVPDGIGLVIGSKIIGKPLSERVTGIDLMEQLLKYADKNFKSVYLIGGKEGIASDAGINIKKKYPNIKIAGTHHGYFSGIHTGKPGHSDEEEVIEHIIKADADMVFVALGALKQERFINTYINRLSGRLFMGVGGSLDVYSGTVKRAPVIYQKLGIEWLYRLIKEPFRIKRMMSLPVFLVNVLVKKEQPM